MKQCTYCGKEYPDEASVCAIDEEPLRVVMPPPPVAPASPVMIAPNITRGMRKLFRTLFSVLAIIAHGMGKLFATPFAVLAILFSIGAAGALFDHLNYAYHLSPPDPNGHGYGPDSDASGRVFGTVFSFIALLFAFINFFFYPRSTIGAIKVIILVWCGFLLFIFMNL
jgi:hypothetical protein